MYAMLSRRFGPPVARQPKASQRKGDTITPTKPKKQPAAAKKCRISSIKNPAVGGNDKPEQDVGSVHESDESHWKRHSGDPCRFYCCRCRYIRHKEEFRREFPWLGPRPARMGGHWRLGCDACHWMSKKSPGARRELGWTFARARAWAGFEFSYNGLGGLFKQQIKQNNKKEGHKIAIGASHRLAKVLPAYTVEAAFQPLADNVFQPVADKMATIQPLADNVSQPVADNMAEKCIAAATAQVLDEGALLKGYVPRVQDWLSAWAVFTEQISFRKQARLAGKRLRWIRGNVRKVRRKQLKVMAECRRRHLRQILRKAQFISLSMR